MSQLVSNTLVKFVESTFIQLICLLGNRELSGLSAGCGLVVSLSILGHVTIIDTEDDVSEFLEEGFGQGFFKKYAIISFVGQCLIEISPDFTLSVM